MPNPKKSESQKDYVARYMGSEEAKRTFPDPKQRAAVAFSKYRKRNQVKAVKKAMKEHK